MERNDEVRHPRGGLRHAHVPAHGEPAQEPARRGGQDDPRAYPRQGGGSARDRRDHPGLQREVRRAV